MKKRLTNIACTVVAPLALVFVLVILAVVMIALILYVAYIVIYGLLWGVYLELRGKLG